MGELIFPYVGLPMSLLLLVIGGMMFWDILSSYGKAKGPDALGSRNRFSGWLVKEGRLGQTAPPPSRTAMWVPLLIVWGIGGIMFWVWVMEVFG